MKRLFYINKESNNDTGPKLLSISIGDRHFSFAITDKTGGELYSLSYYTADEITNDLLTETISEHPELNSTFFEVQVCYDHSRSLLVPLQYYYIEGSKVLLNTVYGLNSRAPVIADAINERQLFNVYTLPNDIQECMNRKYPGCKSRHHFTLAIKMMPAGSDDRLLINIRTDEFSFIAMKDNKLLIAQTHVYSSPEDICYYLLKTCHQFSLSQEQVQLSVSGLIEKESQLYRELYQFFVNVEFRNPTWNMPVTEDHEYPAHFFTTLNDLARCAS